MACSDITATLGCFINAAGVKENVAIINEYRKAGNGEAILYKTRYTRPDGTLITLAAGDKVEAGCCPTEGGGGGVVTPTPEFSMTAYFNGTDPNNATTFSASNPLGANEPALAEDSSNVYFSSEDASSWIYNSSTGLYETYVFPETEPIVVTANLAVRTITSGVANDLTNWQTQTNTSNGAWNPATGRFTVNKTGTYQIFLRVMFASAPWTAGVEANSTIWKNGAILTSSPNFAPRTATQFMVTGMAVTTQRLVVGDVITLRAFQQQNANRTTHAPQFSSMTITEVR